jgi:hypothetical protein
MTINNRGLAGQPILPYIDFRSYAGADVFVDLTYLDHTMTECVPTAAAYQLDNITNDVNMIPLTTLPIPPGPATPSQTLQIPGSSMVMTYQYQGSQLCQLSVTATVTDSVTGNPSSIVTVAIIELCAVQTPSGSF